MQNRVVIRVSYNNIDKRGYVARADGVLPPQGISALSLSRLRYKVLGLLPHREADLVWAFNSRAKAHIARQRVLLQARRPGLVQPSRPRPVQPAEPQTAV